MLEWLLMGALVLVIDQGSKAVVLRRPGEPTTGKGPRILLVKNPVVGLGLVKEPWALVLLWSACVVGTVILLYGFSRFQGQGAQVGLGAALGGATGNLVDRLWRGSVVDFIDLRVWPVFNFADIAIVGGVMVALYSAL